MKIVIENINKVINKPPILSAKGLLPAKFSTILLTLLIITPITSTGWGKNRGSPIAKSSNMAPIINEIGCVSLFLAS